MAWIETGMNNGGSGVEIVTFADGTDEQIAAMLDAYYNDKLSWNDMGWTVGDTRVIHLSEMDGPSSSDYNIWYEGDIDIVIVDHDHTDLATSINGHNKACITVQTKTTIKWKDNSTGTMSIKGTSSSYNPSFTKWSELYMRTYLNTKILGAMPSTFSSMIKSSKHYRHDTYNGSTSEEVIDNIFLPSVPEVFGTASKSYYIATNPAEGTQFEYYQTAANIGKGVGFWLSSASSAYSSKRGYYWTAVDSGGSYTYNDGKTRYGLVPAWAM